MKKFILLPILTILLSFAAYSQDLIIESMTIEPSYQKHSAFTYSVSIKNIGVISSNKGLLNIYFGNDASDYSNFFTSDYFPALDADETVTLNFEIGGSEYLEDLDQEVGSYYVNAIIDPDSYNFVDVNPSNNKFQAGVAEVTVSTADILLSNFSLNDATNHVQGKELALNVDVSNPGSTIRGVYVEAYLSADMVFDEEDLKLEKTDYLRFDYQNELTGILLNDFEIPFNLNPGEYYVFLKVDSYDQIQEIDETNNVYQAGSIEVASSNAFLTIDEFSVSYQWTEYGVSLSFNIENTGTTDVTYLDYYVSSYSVGTGYDPRNYYGSGIKAGKSRLEFVDIYDNELSGEYIYIGNNDPNYPLIDEIEVHIGSQPIFNYDFNIVSISSTSQVETEDIQIPLNIELENPNSNSIYDYATIDITLESLDGQIIENYNIRNGVYMDAFETNQLYIKLPNRPTLTAGTYNVTTNITLDYKDGSAGPFTSEIEIFASEYSIDVEILGQNGDIINQGIVYFYEKNANGNINYLGNQNIEEVDGVGQVTFLQSAGDFMFYVVPDESQFPNYLRTVSGNTFKLEQTSFTEINGNTTIQIEPIYVAPNVLNGEKAITGNIVSGTSSARVAYRQTASTNFDQTPVYLIRNSEVVAFTKTDASGSFTFTEVENGEYEIYFDDGNILESNDISANLSIDESTDIVELVVNETGEVAVENLKMELAAFELEASDIEADENNVTIQYQMSNYFKNNSISISNASFYTLIKQNGTVLDSIPFDQNLNLNQNDTLNLKTSISLTSSLMIGDYEIELHFSTPFQDTEFTGTARNFSVIEPHYNIDVIALDENQLPLTSGIVQLFKIDENGAISLFEEQAIQQNRIANFYTTACEYIINVIPEEEIFPQLIPSFQNHQYFFEESDVQNLSVDTEHQIQLINNPQSSLSGSKKVEFNLNDEKFNFSGTQVILSHAADSSVINTFSTENNYLELADMETGEYLLFFNDGTISQNFEKWYSLNVNAQDDLYQIEINTSSSSQNQFDFDFMAQKDTVFNNYNNSDQLDLSFSVDKQDNNFSDELIAFDFRIDLISQSTNDSLSFAYSEMLDFNNFQEIHKTFALNENIQAGFYDVKFNYSSPYTAGFIESNSFPIQIIDGNIYLNNVQFQNEIQENETSLDLQFDLAGSSDSLAKFKVYYEHILLKGEDTLKIQSHDNFINLAKGENMTVDFDLNLDAPLSLGDYNLITRFYPLRRDESNLQLIETPFRIRNQRVSLSNLALNEQLSILSDSLMYSFKISANNQDSIKNLNTQLFTYLIQKEDTLIVTEEELVVDVARSSFTEYVKYIDLNSALGNFLSPGDYQFIIELKHPINNYSKQDHLNFRINDPSIEITELTIPEEIRGDQNEINCSIDIAGNENNNIRSLTTEFLITIKKGTEFITDSLFVKELTIQKSGSITITLPLRFESFLENGDYLVELNYSTQFSNNNSNKITNEFKVYTEPEITSNDNQVNQNYSIYPNPFKNRFTIKGEYDKATLYNQYGKMIRSFHSIKGFENLDEVNSGVYLLVLEYKGKSSYHKIIKK